MKRMIRRIGIALGVLVVLTAAAVFIFRKQILHHYSPQIEQLGHIELRVMDDTTYVNTKLAIHNMTSLKIEIDTLSYVISLFDKVYLKNSTDINASMLSHGHDTIDFKFKIPHAELLKDAKKARKIDDSASYAIDASIQFVAFFGRFDVPVSRTSKIRIPEPPELEILDMKYEKWGLKHIRALSTIKVENRNEVALTIRTLRYSLNIPGRVDLEGDYKENIVIKPRGETTFELPLEIDLQKIGKTILDIITDRDVYNYKLHIVAQLETTEPVTQTFHVDVLKNGSMELKK
ncbi:MAG: LEA type 2 family protein [Flavobacteriales bacterium]